MKSLCEKEIITSEKKSNKGLYDKIYRTIDEWPDWKKQAYNDNFAVSKYSKKLIIKGK
mgnify:CR=1 FL=1